MILFNIKMSKSVKTLEKLFIGQNYFGNYTLTLKNLSVLIDTAKKLDTLAIDEQCQDRKIKVEVTLCKKRKSKKTKEWKIKKMGEISIKDQKTDEVLFSMPTERDEPIEVFQ